jgi:hypothetical protein
MNKDESAFIVTPKQTHLKTILTIKTWEGELVPYTLLNIQSSSLFAAKPNAIYGCILIFTRNFKPQIL